MAGTWSPICFCAICSYTFSLFIKAFMLLTASSLLAPLTFITSPQLQVILYISWRSPPIRLRITLTLPPDNNEIKEPFFPFFDEVKTIQILNVFTLHVFPVFVRRAPPRREGKCIHSCSLLEISKQQTELCLPLIINMLFDKDRSWHRPCYTENRMLNT